MFYIYIYLDIRKPGNYKYGNYSFNYEPFYVGKGKDKRLFDHLILASRTKKRTKLLNKIRKIKMDMKRNPIVLKLNQSINEKTILNEEINLISLIGRSDLNSGPLVNLTDGGEGLSNHIFSEEHRRKLSENNFMKTEEGRMIKILNNPMKHKKFRIKVSKAKKGIIGFHSKEGIERLREFNIGKTIPKEVVDKIIDKTSKLWRLTTPEGKIFTIKNLKEFCRKNGFSPVGFEQVAYGYQKTCNGGWKCESLGKL